MSYSLTKSPLHYRCRFMHKLSTARKSKTAWFTDGYSQQWRWQLDDHKMTDWQYEWLIHVIDLVSWINWQNCANWQRVNYEFDVPSTVALSRIFSSRQTRGRKTLIKVRNLDAVVSCCWSEAKLNVSQAVKQGAKHLTHQINWHAVLNTMKSMLSYWWW